MTPSIRYLSFRSFIAFCYAQCKLPDQWASFRDYAARVETAIAFANLIENIDAPGVLGSTEGEKIVESSPSKFPLEPLVKQLAVNIYAGPSDQLALSFSTESGIPGLTKERGLELASIAHSRISKSEIGLRFSRGEIIKDANRSQLEELATHVSVSAIPEEERDFLTHVLVPERPLATDLSRVGTYGTLLHLAQTQKGRPPDDALLVATINRDDSQPREFHPILDGWLRYCVRDLISVVHEVVLEQVIETLGRFTDSENYANSNDIIESYVNQVDDQAALLHQLRLLRDGEDFKQLSFNQFCNRIEVETRDGRRDSDGLYRWNGGLEELTIIQAALSARKKGTCAACLLPVSWALSLRRSPVTQSTADDLQDFLSHQGWARIGLRQVIYPLVQRFIKEDWSLLQVIAELTRRTVDQHLRVVWSRLAQDPMRDVAVLNADGELWGYRTDFRAGRTASRLRQAISWLQQLKLIGATGLTADGETVLKESTWHTSKWSCSMNPREFCREKGFSSTILLTYNFDPIFFERVALKELWAGETGDILVVADRNQIAQSSPRWDGQLRDLGRRYQLVAARTPGTFHPKLILRVGQEGAAVWLGSGNVTSGGWGVNRELAAGWTVGPNRSDRGSWLFPLLQRIAEWGPDSSQHNVIRRILETPWIESLESMPNPGGDRAILTSYGNLSLSSQVLARWSERRFDQVLVYTGSSDENGAFLKWLHDNFGVSRSLVVASERNISFLKEQLEALPLSTIVKRPVRCAPMHAKFYWLTGPDGAAAIMGSPNCSAAAWLNSPAGGGNVEAVALYDRPQGSEFEGILEMFQSNDLITIDLSNTRNPLKRETLRAGPTVAEVAWRDDLGTLTVTFNQTEHSIDHVAVDVRGEPILLRPVDVTKLRWVAETPRLIIESGTCFLTVTTRYDENNQSATTAWVNDVNELRHASQGRQIADALRGLGRTAGSSEQQELIRMLGRIGRALLSEPESFPDPFFAEPKADRKPEQGRTSKPINPEEFIRSLSEVDTSAHRTLDPHAGGNLSLSGVMRALFSFETATFDEEADFIDETEGDEPKRGKKGKERKPNKAPVNIPDERVRERLRKHIEEFIDHLSEKDFAEHCTASQLIQSAAYPIAVATLGMPTGWVDDLLARKWATRVFDILFRQNRTGIIQEVQTRYRNQGKDADFVRIVGDGTLWLALLTAVSLPAWEGETGGFEKALAIRSVVLSRDLIASTETGRMGALVASLDERRARAIMRIAPRATSLLNNLEQMLQDDFQRLLDFQRVDRTANSVGDLLWKPEAGWAACQDASGWGENIKAYLHLRAGTKLISSRVFINVTKAAVGNDRLEKIFARLSEQ